MVKYKNIISLGSFCSVAMEIDRINRRSGSYPFDWCISEWEGVMHLVENHFSDFLNKDDLKQSKIDPSHYVNKYGIQFFHDFNAYEKLETQLPKIYSKYERRIDGFYKRIAEPTIFIRYIHDQAEADYICDHEDDILRLFKQYNIENKILWVANTDINVSNIKCYFVEKDIDDTVARGFLDKCPELLEECLLIEAKRKPVKYYWAKIKRNITKRLETLNKKEQKAYIHDKLY